MIERSPPPTIDPNDPWADDIFSRKEEGEILAALVTGAQTQPITISLLAPWGSGKSVFVERFVRHLHAEWRMKSVVIDAWKSDHHGDPLTPILAQLMDTIEAVREKNGDQPGAADRAITAIAKAAPKFILPAAAVVANAMIPGSGAIASGVAGLAQNALDVQRARTRAEPEFREALTQTRDVIAGRKPDGPVRPILVVIDELDRCRPSYAIQMLERIKHYFDIPGIVFLVVTDHGNIPSAVRTVYGQHVDGERYLRKFFDYEFLLKSASVQAFATYLVSTMFDPSVPGAIPSDLERYPLSFSLEHGQPRDDLDKYEYTKHFSNFSAQFGLNARDQLQAFTLIKAFLSTRPRGYVTYPLIDCFVACLRFGAPLSFLSLARDDLEAVTDDIRWKETGINLGPERDLVKLYFSWLPLHRHPLANPLKSYIDRITADGSSIIDDVVDAAAFLARAVLTPKGPTAKTYVQQIIRLSNAVSNTNNSPRLRQILTD